MWNSCFIVWKEVDNGRTPIQSWKKNSVRNRPFRLSKVQEALPRSCEQEDCFDIARWEHIALRKRRLGLLKFLKPKVSGKNKKCQKLVFPDI
jgi:hypothetical protein